MKNDEIKIRGLIKERDDFILKKVTGYLTGYAKLSNRLRNRLYNCKARRNEEEIWEVQQVQ